MEEKKYLLYIDGEFKNGAGNEWLPVINPADESLVGLAAMAATEDAEAAVQAAKMAFDNGSWSGKSARERAAVLRNIAGRMKEKQSELVQLIIEESGATIFKAKAEVALAIGTMDYYAGLIESPYVYEPVIPGAEDRVNSYDFVQREPIGVCAGIVPWNFPLSLGMWKISPALAAGNTMVIKAPSEAPLTLLAMAEIAQEAGLPHGVLNIIAGSGRVIGEYLAQHSAIDKISFTGSTGVGKRILELSAASNLKITTLELGGKSANIILADADLDAAIDGSLFATMLHSGQVCESGTRLLVPQSQYEEILERLVVRGGEYPRRKSGRSSYGNGTGYFQKAKGKN